MSSPIAHSLAGLGIGFLSWRKVFKAPLTWKSILFCVIMANLPDFDVIPGIFAGDINLYHHAYTHTFLFAFAASLAVSALAPRSRLKWAYMSFILVLSHFAIDYITIDRSPPIGLPLLWPFSDMRFKWEFAFLPVVARGSSLVSIINAHNIRTAAIETAVFLPFTILSYFLYRQKKVIR